MICAVDLISSPFAIAFYIVLVLFGEYLIYIVARALYKRYHNSSALSVRSDNDVEMKLTSDVNDIEKEEDEESR